MRTRGAPLRRFINRLRSHNRHWRSEESLNLLRTLVQRLLLGNAQGQQPCTDHNRQHRNHEPDVRVFHSVHSICIRTSCASPLQWLLHKEVIRRLRESAFAVLPEPVTHCSGGTKARDISSQGKRLSHGVPLPHVPASFHEYVGRHEQHVYQGEIRASSAQPSNWRRTI